MSANLHLVNDEVFNEIKSKNIDKIEIIYNGNTQGWQNVDLILDVITNNQTQTIYYTILKGDKEIFEFKIKEKNITPESITVESRHPSDLWKDYIIADYAFIPRNDNIINNVANPTKLIEYLY